MGDDEEEEEGRKEEGEDKEEEEDKGWKYLSHWPCSCPWTDNEGSRTESATQFEPIFCDHHSKDIQRREQVQYPTVFL